MFPRNGGGRGRSARRPGRPFPMIPKARGGALPVMGHGSWNLFCSIPLGPNLEAHGGKKAGWPRVGMEILGSEAPPPRGRKRSTSQPKGAMLTREFSKDRPEFQQQHRGAQKQPRPRNPLHASFTTLSPPLGIRGVNTKRAAVKRCQAKSRGEGKGLGDFRARQDAVPTLRFEDGWSCALRSDEGPPGR